MWADACRMSGLVRRLLRVLARRAPGGPPKAEPGAAPGCGGAQRSRLDPIRLNSATRRGQPRIAADQSRDQSRISRRVDRTETWIGNLATPRAETEPLRSIRRQEMLSICASPLRLVYG